MGGKSAAATHRAGGLGVHDANVSTGDCLCRNSASSYLPKAHAFETQLTYLCFDPDQLSSFTQKSWLWSSSRWNLLTLDERDFLNMEYGSIRQKVARLLIKHENYHLPHAASIRVLALPRTLGFRFNSVVFYLIFDTTDQLIFILSEITNTPWNERQVYIHDCRHNVTKHTPYQSHQFDFKRPFMCHHSCRCHWIIVGVLAFQNSKM
jgi:DUF1365 family protein